MNALDQDLQLVTQGSSPEVKIQLFRSLFRGREDVYPRRFESRKTNKAGYALACANEWVRGVCEKPKIKCSDCPNRRFLPVVDEVLRWHLSGRDNLGRDFVMGLYPMLLDETCWFLAVDFDRESWQADAGRSLIPAVAWRSQRPWRDRVPAMVLTFGFSLTSRFPQCSRANWVRSF